MATANSKSANNSADKQEELAASREAVSEAYNKLIDAKNHFKVAAESAGVDVKNDATEQLLKGRDKASELADQATGYMKEKPLVTAGIAFAAGFLASKVLSSK